MAIQDITFLIVFGSGIFFFTAFAFHWKGIIWLGWLSAIFWLLLGLWCRTTLDVTFMFQRSVGILFIGIAIAMFLSPFWIGAKDSDIEKDAPDDIDIWGEKYNAHRAKIDRLKSLKKRT